MRTNYDPVAEPAYHCWFIGFRHGEDGIEYYPPTRWGGTNAQRWGPHQAEYDRGYREGQEHYRNRLKPTPAKGS